MLCWSITVSIDPAGSPTRPANSLSQVTIKRGEQNDPDMAPVDEDGMAEVERSLAGDTANLIVADGEIAGLPGAAKIGAVANIDLTGHRHAAAEDVAVCANDSQVGI